MKRFHWFEISLITVIMAVHLYAAFSAPHNFSMNWFTRDDAYYYFKVAQNITEGHGSSFDGINLTNGYHPLWMAICIPIFFLARFDLILPLRILLIVMAAISAATSVLLFRLLRKIIPEPVAMLAASYWGLSTLIHNIVTQPGMETGITALSIVLMLYLLQKFDEKWRIAAVTRRDIALLALAACFVLFSRLDSVYLALLAGVWILFRRTPIRYLLPMDLLATFSIIVFAYIQRAGLEVYLLVYADSAIIASAVIFAIQAIVFYCVGLYGHPKNQSILTIVRQALIGVTISTLLSAAILWGLSATTKLVDLPRAIPLIYWMMAFLVTVLTRLAVRMVSPWDTSPPNETQSPLGQFRQSGKTWLGEGLTYYGILGTALGAYWLFNKWMFGTFMPVSGQVKRWWGSLPNNVYGGGPQSILDMFAIDPHLSQAWRLFTAPISDWVSHIPKRFGHFDNIYWTVMLLIAVIGLFLFLRNRRKNLPRIFQMGLIPLLISAELQAFLYGAMGYAAAHEWYWTMQMFSVVLLAALVLGNLIELLPRHKLISRLTWVSAGAISIYLACSFAVTIYDRMPYQDAWAGKPYMDMLPILEGYTEPGSIIGMTGGGNAGYFIKDRTVVNMDGLINSYAYFQAVKEGKAGAYLQKMGMKYIFGSYYILTESMPYRPNLAGQLREIPGVPAYGNKELLRLTPGP
ncbi:MAG: hypothetical protein WA821_13825 [Anaerolineales bacterium]